MKGLTIRSYRPEDWQALCAIHDSARRQELALAGLAPAFLPLEVAGPAEGLLEYPHLDVALVKGEPVGFCAYTEEELAWLYVSPAWQRRGIGRALGERALQQEPGIECIEVLVGNEPARRLYESLGFAVRATLSGQMPGNEGYSVQVHAMERLASGEKTG